MEKKTYSVSHFKAQALALFGRVARTGQSILVTKNGKPLAKVIAASEETATTPVPGKLNGTIVDEKDIVAPLGADLWTATR